MWATDGASLTLMAVVNFDLGTTKASRICQSGPERVEFWLRKRRLAKASGHGEDKTTPFQYNGIVCLVRVR